MASHLAQWAIAWWIVPKSSAPGLVSVIMLSPVFGPLVVLLLMVAGLAFIVWLATPDGSSPAPTYDFYGEYQRAVARLAVDRGSAENLPADGEHPCYREESALGKVYYSFFLGEEWEQRTWVTLHVENFDVNLPQIDLESYCIREKNESDGALAKARFGDQDIDTLWDARSNDPDFFARDFSQAGREALCLFVKTFRRVCITTSRNTIQMFYAWAPEPRDVATFVEQTLAICAALQEAARARSQRLGTVE